MKALTVRQPWATLIVTGRKAIETRSWRTKYTGPLLIHAAKGPPSYDERTLMIDLGMDTLADRLPFGAIIGWVRIVACAPTELGGLAYPVTEHERSLGDYTPGRWAWILEDPIRYLAPRAARGHLGLWEIDW